jgi:hypothetical protein
MTTSPLRQGYGHALVALALNTVLLAATLSCAANDESGQARAFNTPEDAAKALIDTVATGGRSDVLALFGPDANDLILSSDPNIARRNREIFSAATREKWTLTDEGPGRKTLVIGREEWPFPIPIVSSGAQWRFDTASGTEEVLARRIGRNELAAMQISGRYLIAQRAYARQAHDGQPAGRYATAFRSDPGRQNGLYWPAKRGERKSPLGDLVARAAQEGRILGTSERPAPFHGYYFRILPSDGGFAMVAWPAEYDITGVMTFQINQTGVLYQKDLGAATADVVKQIARYEPDGSWTKAQ